MHPQIYITSQIDESADVTVGVLASQYTAAGRPLVQVGGIIMHIIWRYKHGGSG